MKASARIVGILALGIAIGFAIAQLNSSPTVAAPWSAKSKFEFRQLRSNNGVQQVFRFDPKTGETWQITKKDWVKIPETEKPPAGEYDLLLSPGASDTGYWVTRTEQISGKAWTLGKETWEEAGEAK